MKSSDKKTQVVKNLDPVELEKTLMRTLSMSFAYLDRAVKDLNEMDLKKADKFKDADKTKFNLLHNAIAVALDVTHRSYPLCYDLFDENKNNLDNSYLMYKRFEKAGLLKPCPCQYCKDNPIKEEIKTTESKSSDKEIGKEVK